MLKKAALLAGVLVLSACGSDTSTNAPSPTPTPSATPTVVNDPAKLTLGVWGTPAELAAWGTSVTNYNASTDLADVTLKTWGSAAAMTTALDNPSTALPDVFLISRADLDQLDADKRVAPVDEFLDARAVDIGDQYSRDALEALTKNQRLECMPYGVSNRVVYYNTDLVDFPRMHAQGIDTPNVTTSKSWTWDQFQLAAQEAATKDGVKPFAVAPSLGGLAPFLLSAGGTFTNDDGTSLALSSDDNLDALEEVLPVLANPTLTTTATAAQQLRWFTRGKLAMMIGDRSIVPTLRAETDLRWDVLPVPTIDKTITTGDYTALCLSATSTRIEAAADLLVGLSSVSGVTPLALTGSIVPVNQEVALSAAFVQPDQEPLHAGVFTRSVRSMQILPLAREWATLEAATSAKVAQLFVPGQIPVTVKKAASEIDAAAAALLTPATASATPSGAATPQ